MDSLNALMFRLVDNLVPKAQRTGSEDDLRYTRTVYFTMCISMLVSITLGSGRMARGEIGIGILSLLAATLFGMTPLAHRLTGSRKGAAAWMMALLTLLMLFHTTFAGGMDSTSCLWHGPIIVFILVTQGARIALVWLGFIALHSVLIFWLPFYGVILPDLSNPEKKPITWLIAAPAGLFSTVLLLFGFFESHRHAVKALIRQTLELEKARTQAEAASKARSEFIAVVSHEIRTPMNGILGVAQLFEGTPLDADQRKFLKAMNQSAESLLTILGDILDFSKMEAGKLSVSLEPIALQSLCDDCISLFSGISQSKGLRLRLDLQPGLPSHVTGDPVRLRQILNNLIGNAIKFTSAGEVGVQVARVEDRDGFIRFSVKDTGIGMSDTTLGMMFQPYTQADASASRKYGGTGLGLAICNRLTLLMGGTLTATSRLGEGSCFTLDLPLPQAQERKPLLPPPPLAHPSATAGSPATGSQASGHPLAENRLTPPGRPAVLLVEDQEVNLMVAEKMLERLGAQVSMAKDGIEAVAQWRAGRFDLIFMDCQMPNMDGYEATRTIRGLETESRPGSHTPIVAMTAHAMPEERQRCLDAGMDDYLTKPIDMGALRRLLGAWVG